MSTSGRPLTSQVLYGKLRANEREETMGWREWAVTITGYALLGAAVAEIIMAVTGRLR